MLCVLFIFFLQCVASHPDTRMLFLNGNLLISLTCEYFFTHFSLVLYSWCNCITCENKIICFASMWKSLIVLYRISFISIFYMLHTKWAIPVVSCVPYKRDQLWLNYGVQLSWWLGWKMIGGWAMVFFFWGGGGGGLGPVTSFVSLIR